MDWPSVLFLNADDKVAAAPIINIIGKGADRLEGRLSIPRFFELDPGPLNSVSGE